MANIDCHVIYVKGNATERNPLKQVALLHEIGTPENGCPNIGTDKECTCPGEDPVTCVWYGKDDITVSEEFYAMINDGLGAYEVDDVDTPTEIIEIV